MKKLYTCLGIMACLLLFNTAQSQVLLLEDFDDGDIPTGWNSVGFIPTSAYACDGGALRRHFHSPNSTSGTLESPSQNAEGDDIEISFDYKIIDDASGEGMSGDFGSLALQYSLDGGSYTTYYTIDSGNHSVSSSCQTQVNTISGADVPDGSEIRWRISGTWNDGDYNVYIDNFSMVEQAGCVQPYKIEFSDLSTDEVTIDWTDLSTNYASWDITYVAEGLPPTPSFGAITVNTTSHPYTLTGLEEGTGYDIYVTANCDDGGTSDQVGPVNFRTIALGTDCENPLEITSLPYAHLDQDTGNYGNDYSGTAGAGCGAADGEYLNGYDVVYHYVPSKDDILQINLSNISEEYSGIFVYGSCDDIGVKNTACLGGSTRHSKDDHGISDLFVTAGEDYYIVVSSWPQVGGAESFKYDLNIEGFDCTTFEVPKGDAIQDFISGQELSDLIVSPTMGEAFLTWYSDAALSTEIPMTTPLVDGTTYYVTQSISDCESEALEVLVEVFDCESGLEIVNTEAGQGACGSGTVNLNAEAANEDDNIFWWDAETGGNTVFSGPDFTTPELEETTSYWVSESFVGMETVNGQANPGPSSAGYAVDEKKGLTFTLKKPIILKDFEVYNADLEGVLVLRLEGNPSDPSLPAVEKSFSQKIPEGLASLPKRSVIDIDYKIPPGTYTLKQVSELKLVSGGTDFPYNIGVSGQVTDAADNSKNYFYFYNWTILEERPLCESERIEVKATVHPIIPIDLSISEDLVCVGEGTEITVDTDNDKYTFEVTWNDGDESDTNFDSNNTVVVYPTKNTEYTVIATDPSTGCQTSETMDVKVKKLPEELEISKESIVVCADGSIELFANGIGANFESEADLGWTTVDNSSNDAAAWSLVQSPYGNAEVASNDYSKFYIAQAMDLEPDDVLDVSLVSSSFSLVGLQDAFIDFYHQYRTHASTVADVDVSIDGGDSWENIVSYAENRGKADKFARERLSLKKYINEEDVRVRFHYSGGWGWWWAIDNITIGRQPEGEVIWSPLEDLYLDEDATVAYDGSDASSVFYKGEEENSATYTATLTVPDCGDVIGSVVVKAQVIEPPLADANQTLLEGSIVNDIKVDGENLSWYKNENGTQLLSSNTLLEDGETYYASQTIKGCESGLTGITITLFTESVDCPGPTELVVEYLTNDTAIISWKEPESQEVENYYYQLYKSDDNTLIEDGKILRGGEMIRLENLKPKSNYSFNIYSVCDNKLGVYSEPSAVIEFTTKELGVDVFNFKNFTYYPNPTEGRITLRNAVPIEYVEVYDLRGRKIRDKKVNKRNEVELDLSDVSSGVYFMKAKAGDGEKMVKIIKK